MIPFAWLPILFGVAVTAPEKGVPMLAPTIVRIALHPESEQRFPVIVPTEPELTVELDFPWPLADWVGRGFTPDPEKFAGDFIVGATRGSRRLFVVPIVADAHRVLDVVLAQDAGGASVPIEFIPAPPGLSWRKVIFTPASPPPDASVSPIVRLSVQPPSSPYREATVETRTGFLRTLRLLAGLPTDLGRGVLEANPQLQYAAGRWSRDLDGYAIGLRFALRDRTTGALGLCVDVVNATRGPLTFDRQGWIVRTRDRAYPARTDEFSGKIGPHARQAIFLLLGDDPDGAANRVLPDNDFTVEARLVR